MSLRPQSNYSEGYAQFLPARGDRIIQAVIFGVSIVGLILVALSPPALVTSVHSWKLNDSMVQSAGLGNPAAREFRIEGFCPSSQLPKEELLGSANWALSVDGRTLIFVAKPNPDELLIELPDGDCEFSFLYRFDLKTVTHQVFPTDPSRDGSKTRIELTEELLVSEIRVGPSASLILDTISVETQPWGLSRTLERALGQLLLFGALLSAFFFFRGKFRPVDSTVLAPFRIKDRRVLDRQAWPIHIFVAGFLMTAMLLMPSHFDDGWIYKRIDDSISTALQVDPYVDSQLLVQGAALDKFLGVLLLGGLTIDGLRLAVVLALSVSWIYLANTLVSLGLLRRTVDLIVPASLFVAMSVSFLTTVRPEPFIVVLSALFFVAFFRYLFSGSRFTLLIAGILATVAPAIHHSGFVLLPPGLVLLGLALYESRGQSKRTLEVFLILWMAISAALSLILIELDVQTLMRTLAGPVGTSPGYLQPEWVRWERLSSDLGIYWWPILLGVLAAIFVLGRISNYRGFQWVIVGAVLSPIGLFFTPSKWLWHLGTLTVPLVIFAAIAAPSIRRFFGRPGNKALLIAFLGIAAIAALGSSEIRHWIYPHLVYPEGILGAIFPGVAVGLMAIAFPFMLLLFVFVTTKSDLLTRFLSIPLVGFLILSPAVNFYGALAADALVHEGWTPAKQRINEIRGQETCGLLDDVDVIIDAQARGGIPGGVFSTPYGPFGLDAVLLTSPGESLVLSIDGSNEDLVMWVKGTERNTDVLVELGNSEGQTRHLNITELDDEMWRLVTIPRASRWETVQVWSLPNARGRSGVLVSVPAEPVREGSLTALPGTTIFAGPMVNTYIPCANEPGVSEGLWEPSDYLFRNDWGWPIGSQGIYGDFVEVAYRDGVRGSFISLVKVVSE